MTREQWYDLERKQVREYYREGLMTLAELREALKLIDERYPEMTK